MKLDPTRTPLERKLLDLPLDSDDVVYAALNPFPNARANTTARAHRAVTPPRWRPTLLPTLIVAGTGLILAGAVGGVAAAIFFLIRIIGVFG